MEYRIATVCCALFLAIATLGGCTNGGLSSEDTGTVLGGVAGGVAGSQIGGGTGKTIATVVGALAGAALGRRLGQNMDQQDRRQFGSALENNKTGNTKAWTNPDTKNQYSVTPTKTYNSDQRPCRRFTVNAQINGQPDKAHGTACRQPDGTWKVQS